MSERATHSWKAIIFIFYHIKASGTYYPSSAPRKRHRQDGCGLEVLGNKVIN